MRYDVLPWIDDGTAHARLSAEAGAAVESLADLGWLLDVHVPLTSPARRDPITYTAEQIIGRALVRYTRNPLPLVCRFSSRKRTPTMNVSLTGREETTR